MTDQTMNHISLNFDLYLTKEEIDNILSAVLDEGTAEYTAQVETAEEEFLGDYITEQISLNGALIFHLDESVDNTDQTEYTLTKEKFLKGLKQYITENENGANILAFDNGQLIVDTSTVDAGIADAILQYALFDEIVFPVRKHAFV